MIEGPFSEDYFWYDESESDPEFLDHWDDTLSAQSSDDWGWDEWGDLVVFRPVGYSPRYQYPLIVWLSLDAVPGVTLRDWFPDLSDRNYIGAEIRLSADLTISQNADRVAIAIREIVALYGIHMRRIWVAGTGSAADAVLQMLPALSRLVAGGVAITPAELDAADPYSSLGLSGKTLYIATETGAATEAAECLQEEWEIHDADCHLTEWDSIDATRLAICRDLNAWLMQQVCAPAGHDSRG